MSILASELIQYNAASMPEADTGVSGGAIDLTARPDLAQFAANAVAAVISDGADTRTVTVYGRNAAGVYVSEAIVLNGAVEVLGTTTFERILKVVLSATSATRTVLVKQGTGGVTKATIGPNETTRAALFIESASGAGILIRYMKTFWKNTNATLTLTAASMKLTADPAARIRIGCAPSVGDTATSATRLTAPASVTFVDDNVAQGVPGGSLAAAAAIGVWVECNLPANDPANKSTFTTELSGSTT